VRYILSIVVVKAQIAFSVILFCATIADFDADVFSLCQSLVRDKCDKIRKCGMSVSMSMSIILSICI